MSMYLAQKYLKFGDTIFTSLTGDLDGTTILRGHAM